MHIIEIVKMAAVDELINRGLSLVNTFQRKLLDDPEGDFSSDLLYSDDRPISPIVNDEHGENTATCGGMARNVVATFLLPAKVICTYG